MYSYYSSVMVFGTDMNPDDVYTSDMWVGKVLGIGQDSKKVSNLSIILVLISKCYTILAGMATN